VDRYDRSYCKNNDVRKKNPWLDRVGDSYYICIMSYVMIKTIRDVVKQIDLPVIMLDSQSEILEFDTEGEAIKLAELMNANTDSGHKYSVKKIG
jgi:hypothetical protein